MPADLTIALSPYHLATREPPAMLALTLADRVVTLVPQPAGGATRESVRAAVQSSPRYLRLMESWRWSTPLWNSGVISSGIDDDQACDELPSVYDSIASQDSLACLRILTRGAEQRAAESAEKSLDFIAADMLRGGPDPGINIPVSAALDRFALRHGLCVARSGVSSIAQRAEAKLGQRLFSIAIPILLRAGGGRIQLLRNDLQGPLDALRNAITTVVEAAESDADSPHPQELAEAFEIVHRAAEEYAAAFQRWSGDGAKGDDENAERITSGYVGLTAMLLPPDAVLRSSRAAIRALGGDTGARDTNGSHTADEDAPEPQRLVALIVREMNVRPEAA